MKTFLSIICFILAGVVYASDSLYTKTNNKEDMLITIVESVPEFDGGIEALYKYLGENIVYPEVAKKDSIQGKVILQFIVDSDGSIRDVVVVKSSGNSLIDTEAIRVVRAMPKWIPKKEKGQPVRSKYTLPIIFKIN